MTFEISAFCLKYFSYFFPYCIMHGSGERNCITSGTRLFFFASFAGRSLSNSVINLGVRDQYADALNQLGFEFEVLAEQVSEACWKTAFWHTTRWSVEYQLLEWILMFEMLEPLIKLVFILIFFIIIIHILQEQINKSSSHCAWIYFRIYCRIIILSHSKTCAPA